MAKVKNKTLVEWSKEIEKRNHVNVKHVIDKTESITVEGIIAVKFNSKYYKASVILT